MYGFQPKQLVTWPCSSPLKGKLIYRWQWLVFATIDVSNLQCWMTHSRDRRGSKFLKWVTWPCSRPVNPLESRGNYNAHIVDRDACLSSLDLSIVSLNMHGYNQGLPAIKQLIEKKFPWCDVSSGTLWQLSCIRGTWEVGLLEHETIILQDRASDR